MTTTFSSIIGYSFDTIIVASTDEEWYSIDPSKYKYWKPLVVNSYKEIIFFPSYQMSSSLVLNSRSKDAFTESKTQVFLLSDNNSTARIGRAVVESHGNIPLLIIRNRYLFDFLRKTVRLSIVYDNIVRCGGLDNTIEKGGHLRRKQSKAISGEFFFGT